MHHPTDRITHTTAVGTPAVENWLEREIFSRILHHLEGYVERVWEAINSYPSLKTNSAVSNP